MAVYVRPEKKMKLFYLTVATALAADKIKLSYGTFDALYCEPLEMAQAIEHCKKLNGRLPRFNNHDDYNKLGALYAKYGLTHTWVRSCLSLICNVHFSLRLLTGQ